MEKMILNETPVRTSVNFNINDIIIDDLNIPVKKKKFENVKINYDKTKVILEENTCNFSVNYGVSKGLTNNVCKNANSNIKLTICEDLDRSINIEYKFDEKNNTLIDNMNIIANENKKATVVLKYIGNKNSKCIHNQVLRVLAKEKSNINIIILNFMNLNSNNFLAIDSRIEDNAKLNYTIVDFGGKNSITNYYSNLCGNNSQNILNTIYLGSKNQLFDLNYIAHLEGVKSSVDIQVEGALKDSAKKHFKGTIDFKKGSKKSVGNENESCMLLSGMARSLSLPMLLCSEEDVTGNHASSAGKIDDKELFYIMSRGFNKNEAMKLMVRAKFNRIIETIKDDKIKEEVLKEIDRKLD